MDKGRSGKRNYLDADFDSYWLDESRNKNRNRIRVGRQYQATVPPLLKPGENDGRRCEDLETLKWKPEYDLSEQQLDHYLSVAKAVSLFARAINVYQEIDAPQEKCLQTALRGLSEFVTSHHPGHHDAGCQKVPNKNSVNQSSSNSGASSSFVTSNWLAAATANWDSKEVDSESVGTGGGASCSSLLGGLARCEWTPQEADLFAKALEVCGKNFGAIKKEFLPWKPVKSIIEFYYCGKGDIKPTPDIKLPILLQTPGVEEIPNNTKTELKSGEATSPGNQIEEKSSTDMVSASSVENFSIPATTEKKEVESDKDERPEVRENSSSKVNEDKLIVETKEEVLETNKSVEMVPPPLSAVAEPPNSVSKSEEQTVNQNSSIDNLGSTVGSLKFYLGGQLVLKLNAQQDAASNSPQEKKCHWVQSCDTPKLSLPTRKAQKTKKKLSQCGKSDSAESHPGWSPNGPQDPCGSTSPSDRDGTDSERSHTPDVWTPDVFVASKKTAKVKRSPLTLSGTTTTTSTSVLPRLSPKPPWTPPVEYFRYEKSPGGIEDASSCSELNLRGSPKTNRIVKSEHSPAAHVHRSSPLLSSQRTSPGLWDGNYGGSKAALMSGFVGSPSSSLIKTPPPTPPSLPPPSSPCSEHKMMTKIYHGTKQQYVGSDRNPWSSSSGGSVLGLPVICPTNFRSQDETPLDLSKKAPSKGCSNISQGSSSPRNVNAYTLSSASSHTQPAPRESNEETITSARNDSTSKKSKKTKSVQSNDSNSLEKNGESSKRPKMFPNNGDQR